MLAVVVLLLGKHLKDSYFLHIPTSYIQTKLTQAHVIRKTSFQSSQPSSLPFRCGTTTQVAGRVGADVVHHQFGPLVFGLSAVLRTMFSGQPGQGQTFQTPRSLGGVELLNS